MLIQILNPHRKEYINILNLKQYLLKLKFKKETQFIKSFTIKNELLPIQTCIVGHKDRS
jgi:hypothetical protein